MPLSLVSPHLNNNTVKDTSVQVLADMHNIHPNSEANKSEPEPDSATQMQMQMQMQTQTQTPSATRAKRNRYISIACNECKRRKIKCNGQVPCQRCGHLKLECLYAPNCCNGNFRDSEEFRLMKQQIGTLQEQVKSLFTRLNELCSHKSSAESPHFDPFPKDDPASGPPSQTTPSERHHRFHGPTSSTFHLDVAKSSLQTMGIASVDDGVHDDLMTAQASPVSSCAQPMTPALILTVHPSKDPIWMVRRQDAIRLCRVYDDEIGSMYPIFDIDTLINQTNLLYTFLEAAARTGLVQQGLAGADCLQDDNTNHLKLILATTLMLEGHGQSDLGERLFENVKPIIHTKMWGPADIKSIQLLILAAMYHFHTDDDIMAYRLIGLTARMCLEMGLHRSDALMKAFPNQEQWADVNRIFWTVYALDRRWSFGAGLPFVIQDEDIDQTLPEPDGSTLHLQYMTSYNRIGSKIWYSGLGSDGTAEVKRDRIGYLDYQVLQWYKEIPDNLKFYTLESLGHGESTSRSMQRLRVVLYLRMNQLRMLIYRPVLHSAASIIDNRSHAQAVVGIAKDTIRVLTRLNQTSDLYRTQQVCFNYFLLAALAILFLAVCHASAVFNREVRDEFYMALDLVRGFRTRSYVAKRLWNTIKCIRKIAERLGLFARNFGLDSSDPHSTAAVAMAGLAGHSVTELTTYGTLSGVNELENSPMNGLQMTHELTHLFEAVGGYGHFMASNPGAESINGFISSEGELHNGGDGLTGVLGTEDAFSRVLGDLF